MPRSSTTWKKGQSGNPNGRPKRALAEILRKKGAGWMEYDGKRISRKHLVAQLLWQGAATGWVEFPDGHKIGAEFSDWMQLVKFIYTHIDGPAKQDIGVEGGEVPIQILVEYVNDWRENQTPDAAHGTEDD